MQHQQLQHKLNVLEHQNEQCQKDLAKSQAAMVQTLETRTKQVQHKLKLAQCYCATISMSPRPWSMRWKRHYKTRNDSTWPKWTSSPVRGSTKNRKFGNETWSFRLVDEWDTGGRTREGSGFWKQRELPNQSDRPSSS
jgi:hypothetical protein